MATILHLIKSADAALARTVIEQHVGSELSYSQLLDLIFESDRVVTW